MRRELKKVDLLEFKFMDFKQGLQLQKCWLIVEMILVGLALLFILVQKYNIKGDSINSGAFRNLYNYLDVKNQANIETACNYMNNSEIIDKILSTKSINGARESFLTNQKANKSLTYLLDLVLHSAHAKSSDRTTAQSAQRRIPISQEQGRLLSKL